MCFVNNAQIKLTVAISWPVTMFGEHTHTGSLRTFQASPCRLLGSLAGESAALHLQSPSSDCWLSSRKACPSSVECWPSWWVSAFALWSCRPQGTAVNQHGLLLPAAAAEPCRLPPLLGRAWSSASLCGQWTNQGCCKWCSVSANGKTWVPLRAPTEATNLSSQSSLNVLTASCT